MQRQPVSSSNIASVGYDAVQQTLEVAFHNGAVYQYFNVPAHIYTGLMQAASHGQYLDAFVKKAGYTYHRVL
ncbi:MAG: KTSC domain-containing protein [Chloroflexales bacterium]|jgi:hypothetical protein